VVSCVQVSVLGGNFVLNKSENIYIFWYTSGNIQHKLYSLRCPNSTRDTLNVKSIGIIEPCYEYMKVRNIIPIK
jgi:hypothetical protein